MAFLFVLFLAQNTFAFKSVEEGVFVPDAARAFLQELASDGQFVVDHVSREGYEVYGTKGIREKLFLMGVPFRDFPALRFASDYPSYDEYQKALKGIHERYPRWTEIFSIGKSGQGRDLWVVKISDNPKADQIRPEVKYISSMHGDEITGRELMMMLIQKILARYEAGDPEIRKLVNNTEIFIMPSMNPDGSMAHTRANAFGADLNRDFPDFSTEDNQNSLEGRQPETQAVMKFQAARKFALSANFHGGAEVVNYMWDTIPDAHPFEGLLKNISLDYASRVPYMAESTEFKDGITNGYEWYEVNGGMQDWSYYWYGDLHFTIELSNQKWPPFSQMPRFYQDNEAALLKFLTDVHRGAGFFFEKKSVTGSVDIQKKTETGLKDIGSFPFADSEFYKVLDSGEYIFSVKSSVGDAISFETKVSGEIHEGGNFKKL
jgi:hypothetical protein